MSAPGRSASARRCCCVVRRTARGLGVTWARSTRGMRGGPAYRRQGASMLPQTVTRSALDEDNAVFWNTLCGWTMARAAGITGEGEDDLRRFDELYLGYYPYLEGYVP